RTFPKRMISEHVVLAAVFEFRLKQSLLCCPDRAVMQSRLFSKGPRLPAFHARLYHGDIVDPAALNRLISAYLFETRTSKQLTGARYMFDVDEAIVIHLIGASIAKRSSDQAQSRISGQFLQEQLKISRPKRQISIQAGDRLIIHCSY